MSFLRACIVLAVGSPGLIGEARIRHDSSISTSRLEVQGKEVQVRLSLGLEDLMTLVGAKIENPEASGWITQEDFHRLLPDVLEYLSSRFLLSVSGTPGRADLEGGDFPGEGPIPLSNARSPFGVTLRYRFAFPVRSLKIHCELLQDRLKDHRHFAEFSDGQVLAFDGNRQDGEWTTRPSRLGFLLGLLVLGIKYALGAGPGFLLFSLVLGGSAATVRGLIVRSAALFIGCAIPFAMALRGWLAIPEPLLGAGAAGSAVYLALESCLVPRAPGRWILGSGLGFFHGAAMARFLRLSEPGAPLAWGGLFLLGIAGGQLIHGGVWTLTSLVAPRKAGALLKKWASAVGAKLGARRRIRSYGAQEGSLWLREPRTALYLGVSPVTCQSDPPHAAQTSLKLLDEITPPDPLRRESTPT